MRIAFLLLLSIYASAGFAQELFPNTEPASNMPKKVLGIRLTNEFFNELGQVRSLQGIRFMFGLTKNLTLTQTFYASNHHTKLIPADFIKEDANGNLYTNGIVKGRKHPYLFETLNLNIKYRFLSRDGENRHFRMAAWMEFIGGNEAHAEAESSVTGDNAGISAGLIATQLIKRFAVSASVNGILPAPYEEAFRHIEVKYGKALQYSLSFGYLLFPLKYKSYKQTNVNLYVELIGKSYGSGSVSRNDSIVSTAGVGGLMAASYAEVRPAIQFIFKSNLRVDISSAFVLYGHPYTKFFPCFYLNIQRYFYFKK